MDTVCTHPACSITPGKKGSHDHNVLAQPPKSRPVSSNACPFSAQLMSQLINAILSPRLLRNAPDITSLFEELLPPRNWCVCLFASVAPSGRPKWGVRGFLRDPTGCKEKQVFCTQGVSAPLNAKVAENNNSGDNVEMTLSPMVRPRFGGVPLEGQEDKLS